MRQKRIMPKHPILGVVEIIYETVHQPHCLCVLSDIFDECETY